MEYVKGKTLAEQIQDEGPLEVPTALKIIEQVLSALEAAHRLEIVHRDVKPQNIMVDNAGRVRVLDFGLARILSEGRSRLTQAGSILGTPTYISPEQCRGEEVDARADLYSAGVVLYQMVTGRVPFSGDTPEVVIHRILHESFPAVRDTKEVPREVAQIIERATAKDPEDRYASAKEMLEAVRWFLSGERGSLARRPKRKLTRSSKMAWTAAAVLIFAALCSVLYWKRQVSAPLRGEAPPGIPSRHFPDSVLAKPPVFPIVSSFYTGTGLIDGIAALSREELIVVLEAPTSQGTGLLRCRRGDVFSPDDVFSPRGPPFLNPDGLVQLPDGRFAVTDGQSEAVFLVAATGGPPRVFMRGVPCYANPAVAPAEFAGPNVDPGDLLVPYWNPPQIVAANLVTGATRVFVSRSFFSFAKDGVGALEFGPDNRLYVAWSDYWGEQKPPRIYRFDPEGNGEVFLQLDDYAYSRMADFKMEIDPERRWLYYVHAPRDPGPLTGRGLIFRISLETKEIELVTQLTPGCQNIELSPDGERLFIGFYGGVKEARAPGPPLPVELPDPALEAIVRQTLGKSEGQLTQNDLLLLTRLGAANEGIASLKGLEKAENLVRLDLANNHIQDLSPLVTLHCLERLNLSGNSDLDDSQISHLADLRRVSTLDVSGTQTGNRGLESLARMESLRRLDLRQCGQITNEGLLPLGRISTLQALSLNATVISDEGLKPLGGFSQLTELDLSGTKITDAGLVHVLPLNELKNLNLAGTSIGDPGLDTLQRLPQLEELILINTRVTDQGMEKLTGYPQLRYLCLSGCRKITSLSIPILRRIPQLESLNLVECWAVSTPAFVHFKDFPRLRELHIGQSIAIGTISIKHLQDCPDLLILVIRGRTKITPNACDYLKTMTSLKLLGLPSDLFPLDKVDSLRHDLPSCDIRLDLDDPWHVRYLGG